MLQVLLVSWTKGEWLGLAFDVELLKDDTTTDVIANSQEQEALEEEAPPEDGHQKQTAVQVVTTTDGEGNRKWKLMDSSTEIGTKLLIKVSCNSYCVNTTVFLPWRMVREERQEWFGYRGLRA